MKKQIYLLALIALLGSCGAPKQDIVASSASSEESSESSFESVDSNKDFSSSKEESSSTEDSSNEETTPTNLDFSDPSYETRKIASIDEITSDDFFNLGNKIDISISISDAELNKLQEDYKTGYKGEIYRVADLVEINLTNYGNSYSWEYKNVGIRQKGNTSRKDILIDGKINTENHFKLCFDETFDDVEKYSSSFIEEMKTKMNGESYEDRDFLGLDGFDFKWNRNEDTTHIKEIYASYLYQAGGIIAQRVGLSNISMIQKDNGNKSYSFGLCTIYEPAKKQLIKKAFQNNESYLNAPTWKEEKKGTYGVSSVNYGDMYKCTWGVGEGASNTGSPMTSSSILGRKVGVGNISGSYIPTYERKTNTDVEYDDSLLRNAFQTFESSSYSEIEKIVDMEYLAKVSAINYFIGNPDDYRYNYNNYMLYFRRVDGKMIIIPIDNDRVLGITKGMNFENGNTDSKPYSKNTYNGDQKNPLLLKTILSSNENTCKNNYTYTLNSLISSPWASLETFNTFMGVAKETYSDYSFGTSNENMSIDTYLSKKVSTIKNALNIDDPTGDTTVYDDLYIVGNFNDWGNYSTSDLAKYKFNYDGEYNYSLTIDITKSLDNDTLQFKVNAGQQNWSSIDWSFNEDLTKLKKEKSSNAKLQNVKEGDRVSIKFNTNTLVAEIKKL